MRMFAFAGVVLAAGCGGGKDLVPVKGVVTVGGRPLPDATVQFIAQDPGGRDAHGFTDATGAFRLTTFKPADGAAPGTYQVVIQPAVEVEGPVAASQEEAQKAANEGRTRPKRSAVPPQYTRPDQTPLTQDVPTSGDVVIDLQSP